MSKDGAYKLRSFRFLKSISLVSLDSYIFSFSFFALTIFAARSLTLEDLGVFSIIMSTYNLQQAVYTSCFGDGHIIHRINGERQRQALGFALAMGMLGCTIGTTLAFTIFLLPVNLGFVDFSLILLSNLALIALQLLRYHYLASGRPSKSVNLGALFSMIALLWVLNVPQSTSASNAAWIFLGFGVSAILIVTFGLLQIEITIRLSDVRQLFIERKKFLRDALSLSAVIWGSSHLPQLILGSFFNQGLLGIMRGCLALINPIQTIERGMANALLIDAVATKEKRSRLIQLLTKYLLVILPIHISIIFFWFLFCEEIILATIGEKFIIYKDALSILIFIPFAQSIGTFSSAILRSEKHFSTQIITYALTPIVLTLVYFYQRNTDDPKIIFASMLAVIILQSFFITMGLVRRLKSSQGA